MKVINTTSLGEIVVHIEDYSLNNINYSFFSINSMFTMHRNEKNNKVVDYKIYSVLPHGFDNTKLRIKYGDLNFWIEKFLKLKNDNSYYFIEKIDLLSCFIANSDNLYHEFLMLLQNGDVGAKEISLQVYIYRMLKIKEN